MRGIYPGLEVPLHALHATSCSMKLADPLRGHLEPKDFDGQLGCSCERGAGGGSHPGHPAADSSAVRAGAYLYVHFCDGCVEVLQWLALLECLPACVCGLGQRDALDSLMRCFLIGIEGRRAVVAADRSVRRHSTTMATVAAAAVSSDDLELLNTTDPTDPMAQVLGTGHPA
eukprot:scaffold49867_cov26-Tisochrysis_lutea.AAC.3